MASSTSCTWSLLRPQNQKQKTKEISKQFCMTFSTEQIKESEKGNGTNRTSYIASHQLFSTHVCWLYILCLSLKCMAINLHVCKSNQNPNQKDSRSSRSSRSSRKTRSGWSIYALEGQVEPVEKVPVTEFRHRLACYRQRYRIWVQRGRRTRLANFFHII